MFISNFWVIFFIHFVNEVRSCASKLSQHVQILQDVIWTFQEASCSALFRDVSKSSTTRCVRTSAFTWFSYSPQKHKHFLIVTQGKTQIEIKIAGRSITAWNNPTIEWPGFARGNLLIRAVYAHLLNTIKVIRGLLLLLLMSKLFIHQCFVGWEDSPRFEKLTMRCLVKKMCIGYNLAFISHRFENICIGKKQFIYNY